MIPPILRSREAFQEYVLTLTPVERVKIARVLADTVMRGWLSKVADDAVAGLVANRTYDQVATLLGVKYSMVSKRMARYHKRT